MNIKVFVPSRGFLFFYNILKEKEKQIDGFRPLTGISLFLCGEVEMIEHGQIGFRPLTGISLFLLQVHLLLFFLSCFRPLTGISLFL